MTNNYNLPKALVNALTNDTHRGGGDFSTTQLLKSPREFWLTARHSHEIETDAIENMWALFGTASHNIAERGETADSLVEEFMKINIAGVTLTGIFDIFENGVLWDYKTKSVNSLFFFDAQAKATLTSQANIYAYMARKLFELDIKQLKDLFILRDWTRAKAQYNKDYPSTQAQVVELPLFTEEQQKDLIIQRIEWIMKFKDVPDELLPECTKEYRWASPTVYKVYKGNNKTAVRGGANFSSCSEAKAFIDELDPTKKYRIEAIEGNNWRRCEYCSSRAFCNQTQMEEPELRKEHKEIKVNMTYDELMREVKLW